MNELQVEIFAVGKWNGMEFTKEDLNLIANAFHSLGNNHQVPLKMGHNDEQPFTDGQPALGWVTDVFVSGDKLVAKFSDVPDVVMGAFESKLYRNVSVELDFGVEYKSSFFPLVLSGVALLGADIPAVNTLADLQAYMSKSELKHEKRAAFSAVSGKKFGVNTMSDSEEVKALKAQLAAKDQEIDKLVTKVTGLEQEKIEMSAKFRVVEESERNRKIEEQRGLLKTKLEAMVEEKKITPFTRDDFLNDFDQADDKSVIMFAVEKMEKTIAANPAYFGAEQARLKAQQDKNEEGKDVSAIVVERAKQYQVEHGEQSFSVAKRRVLEADKELANRYTKGEEVA